MAERHSLFETLDVSSDTVAQILKTHWNLTLGKEIKASQNRTYTATNDSGTQFAVRVAPARQHSRIVDELFIVQDLSTVGGLFGLCHPIFPIGAHPPQDPAAVLSGDISVSVSKWADGDALNFFTFTWMQDRALLLTWGQFFARFHAASRNFAHRHPDITARVRNYDVLHEGIMADAPIHPDDRQVMNDPEKYGICHGDVNLSNFHLVRAPGDVLSLSVFDFDQIQKSWWEYDLAQAVIGVVMCHEGGTFPAGDTIPQADPAFVTSTLIEGYEMVAGPGAIDRERMQRMIALRKYFYKAFCLRAHQEGVPDGMKTFIQYVVRWTTKNT